LMLLTILIQLSWIKTKYKIFVSAYLIDIYIIYLMNCFNIIPQIIVITTFIFLISVLIYNVYKESIITFCIKPVSVTSDIAELYCFRPCSWLKIYLKNIMANLAQLSIIFTMLILMTVFSICIMLYEKNSAQSPLIISTIMLINALSVSNLFNQTHAQWMNYANYLMSLPISKLTLFKIHFIPACFVTVLFNFSILCMTCLWNNHLCGKFLIALLTSIIYLALTYWPQIQFKRYGYFIAFFLLLLFTYINYLL